MSKHVTLYDVLLGQYITEKSSNAFEKTGQYTFKVAKSADKTKVKSALKSIYDVDVTSCRIVSRPGKKKVRKGGETKSFKLALVALKEGQTIDLSGQ